MKTADDSLTYKHMKMENKPDKFSQYKLPYNNNLKLARSQGKKVKVLK